MDTGRVLIVQRMFFIGHSSCFWEGDIGLEWGLGLQIRVWFWTLGLKLIVNFKSWQNSSVIRIMSVSYDHNNVSIIYLSLKCYDVPRKEVKSYCWKCQGLLNSFLLSASNSNVKMPCMHFFTFDCDFYHFMLCLFWDFQVLLPSFWSLLCISFYCITNNTHFLPEDTLYSLFKCRLAAL